MLPSIATGNVASALAGEYEVANSCRFDTNAGLNKTAANGTRTKATFSTWVKRSILGDESLLFNSRIDASNHMVIRFTGSDKLEFVNRIGASNISFYTTDAVYRDTSAWMHVLWIFDTTLSTSGDRIKLFVNGTRVTDFSTSTTQGQNTDLAANINTAEYYVAQEYTSGDNFFDGYMAEVVWLDGIAGSSTDFGEFDEDSGIWKPKDVSELTFGSSGFYLDFEDASNLGNDVNGGTDLTENNLTSVDQTTDTCTNNFATMNPLVLGSGTTLSEGNLQITPSTNSTGFHTASTMGVSTGKWYWEAKLVSGTKGAFGIIFDGSSGHVFEHQRNNKMPGGFSGNANSWGYKPGNSGNVENNAGDISFSGVTATSSNILGFAMDLDNGALYIHKDGTYMNSGDPTSGSSKTGAIDISGGDSGFVFPAYGDSDSGASPSAAYNFGNPPYSESGGNSDADGYGNFNQSVPSGYYSLNSKNLAEYG